MASLEEDIKKQADWITRAFASDHLQLDYSIRSFIEIDRFFNMHAQEGKGRKGGRLELNPGPIIFSLGSYVGETIIHTLPGSVWQTTDSDPEGEITASIKLADGTIIWPIQKVIKRFKNGSQDSIYIYGHYFTMETTKAPFDNSYWEMENSLKKVKKPWWKFW